MLHPLIRCSNHLKNLFLLFLNLFLFIMLNDVVVYSVTEKEPRDDPTVNLI